jgi:tetratricopeptide (TPR) repeat protein
LAERALQLSPETTLAHVVLQAVHKNQHDWAAAEIESRRALTIDPTSSEALQVTAVLSMAFGRWDDAERQLRTALIRDPLNTYARWALGATYYGAGRFQESEAEFRNMLEVAPTFLWTRMYLAKTLMAQGKLDASLAMLQQESDEGFRLMLLPALLYAMDRREESDAALQAQIKYWGDVDAYCVAATYALRGKHDVALQWLERAYEQHSSSLPEILSEPVFRTEPYRAFLRKIKLIT